MRTGHGQSVGGPKPGASGRGSGLGSGRRHLYAGFALGVLASCAVSFGAGMWKAREAQADGDLDRASFHEAVDAVLDRYVEPVDGPAALSRALKHLVAGLDPYTHYLTAKERRALRRSNADAGVAVHYEQDRGRGVVEVAAVLPGSAGAKAGLRPGDHVVEIRGRPVRDFLSQAEVEALLAGREGERVPLRIQHRDAKAPVDVHVELERPSIKGLVEGRLVYPPTDPAHAGPVAHVRLRAFRGGTGQAFRDQLKELRAAAGRSLAGVVLDVRGNPGGAIEEALVVADTFLDRGVITRTRGRGGVIVREAKASAAGSDLDTPLVVLQDRRSASAAELLAAALQDHGRARIVGQLSYGKGSVQERIGLRDGSQLTLTVAHYYSPNDRAVDGRGVSPDVVVGTRPGMAGDPGLEGALRELLR